LSEAAAQRPAGSHWRAWVGGVDVLFGAGVLQLLGEEARRLGVRRALVVSDPGVVAAGHAERALWGFASAKV
jgi:alcohol dehydrogenase class IV